jgi:hypothetical protein
LLFADEDISPFRKPILAERTKLRRVACRSALFVFVLRSAATRHSTVPECFLHYNPFAVLGFTNDASRQAAAASQIARTP